MLPPQQGPPAVSALHGITWSTAIIPGLLPTQPTFLSWRSGICMTHKLSLYSAHCTSAPSNWPCWPHSSSLDTAFVVEELLHHTDKVWHC